MKRVKKKPIEINVKAKQDYVFGDHVRRKTVSETEIIRESPDKFLRETPLEENPGVGLIGLGNSGRRNLSDNHDKYLARYGRQKKRG
jgi:hypothetical protein